jgi:hypothetical protein
MTPVSARWDRHPVLHLHDGCRVCAWIAARWAKLHDIVGELVALRPARFARDLPDSEEVAA